MKKVLLSIPALLLIACGSQGNDGEFPDVSPDSSVDTPWGNFYFGDFGDGSCSCRAPADIQLKSYRPDNSCVCFVPTPHSDDPNSDSGVDSGNDADAGSTSGGSTVDDADTNFDSSTEGGSDSSSEVDADTDADADSGVSTGGTSTSTGGNTTTTGGTNTSTSGGDTTSGTTTTTGGTTSTTGGDTTTTGGSNTSGTSTTGTTGVNTTGSNTSGTSTTGGTCSGCPTPVPCNSFGFNCNECYVFSYCDVDGKYQEQIACKTETKAFDEQCTRDSGWDYTQGGYRWYVYLCSR